MAQRVNLDAMIPRADFATQENHDFTMQLFKDFPISLLEEAAPIRALLRKPDFQRETNHWSPAQIATFIESFLDNQLIPSLILWKSPNHIFVIDGGHRLSALRAWMADDYGDGAVSLQFYGGDISDDQRKIAKKTRNLIERKIGRYTSLKAQIGSNTADSAIISRANNLVTRALDLQWVQGNAEVAETSFFNINRQGTPLDDVETMLIQNRNKPVAIASRAILRSGSGHKYWSKFPSNRQAQIESLATDLHELLFDPEAETPIRTLDLPLGGSVSPVNALAILIDFILIASSPQNGYRQIADDEEDLDGNETVRALTLAKDVARRFVGNDSASLGLHPAVYFYNERGVHSRHLFLGMVRLLTEKVRNNDSHFFKTFTDVREKLEAFLIANKSIISRSFAYTNREARVLRVRDLLASLITKLSENAEPTIEDVFKAIGVQGRILDIQAVSTKTAFSDDTKAAVYVKASLGQALKCPICNGLLYPKKSVSFDHKIRVRDDGKGDVENAQMTHPYCNSSIKN
ncbi:MAG TPA: DUF262 domain-containing protein [Candidatus Elarobacter sp.]|nr:DUF262 domain-containing protein [Candidatus Elarobacter sp.]